MTFDADSLPPAGESPLARLARAAGIDLEYRDATGAMHQVPAGTVRALLGSLGWAAEDDAAIERTLAERTAAQARRVLEPVSVVVANGGSVGVEATVAAAQQDAELAWRLEEEGGNVRQGKAIPRDLSAASSVDPESGLVRVRIDFGTDIPHGYHRLALSGPATAGRGGCEQVVIVAPGHCYLPPAWQAGGRTWGIAVEPYALRSGRGWGIGDFSALADLAEKAAAMGAQAVGLTPLHALFPARPRMDSPYYASNRAFLNALLVDIEAVPDFVECAAVHDRVASAAFRGTLAELARGDLVDYEAVAAVKFEALRHLFATFHALHLCGFADDETPRAAEFRAFVRRGGRMLEAHATFDALSETFGSDWRSWPKSCRRPDAAGVTAFRAEHRKSVEFHLYLQWEADRQLAAAAAAGTRAGLSVGLYLDIALGVAPDGSEAWMNQDSLVFGTEIGAPPDLFNQRGQGWGLPPFDPDALRKSAYGPFVALLRANMRHAGAVRIDHVMGLMRQYWIPPGKTPAEGAYVRFPLDDLLAVVALESERNRCVVIGEDLGTVPDGLRERLAAAGVLSYRLLYFERSEDRAFVTPARYPALALAGITTHDLPTLAGFWTGHDLDVRARLNLFPSPEAEARSRRERVEDCRTLEQALRAEGGLVAAEPNADDIAVAAYRYLARTTSHLLMVSPADVLGLLDQANLPGTVDQHPNWKRRLPITVDEMMADPRLHRAAAMLADEGRAGR